MSEEQNKTETETPSDNGSASSAEVCYMAITPNINKWLTYGQRGISSEAIVSHLTGINIVGGNRTRDWPHDPADLRRCVELLEAAPEIKDHFHHMAEKSKTWANLVRKWDVVVDLLYKEKEQNQGYCPKTYDYMKSLGC